MFMALCNRERMKVRSLLAVALFLAQCKKFNYSQLMDVCQSKRMRNLPDTEDGEKDRARWEEKEKGIKR